MRRFIGLFTLLMTVSSLVGCSAEYYARRAALREQRIAARQQQHVAQQQRMMELCDPQRAFERGHNAGLARRPLDTSWVPQCPPQQQQQTGTAYMTGYQQGAAIAPAQQVVVARPQPVIVAGGGYGYGGGAVSCRFSSDCGGSDMSCRPWGNMGSVCMGYGGPGSPCWFGSDCLSGSCDGHGARQCR
jgi:hypothetical protein